MKFSFLTIKFTNETFMSNKHGYCFCKYSVANVSVHICKSFITNTLVYHYKHLVALHNNDLLPKLSDISRAENKFDRCKHFYVSPFISMATN